MIIQASRNLAACSAQVHKLISQGGIKQTDEEHIFSKLTEDQITQVYQWVMEYESKSASKAP